MPEWIIAALLAVNAALLATVAVIPYVELRLMEKLKAELLRRVEDIHHIVHGDGALAARGRSRFAEPCYSGRLAMSN